MKIGIAKLGQKIYFNRDSKEVKRSNTNGNFGTYKLLTLLFELNKFDTFYMLSESDLDMTYYPNAIPCCADQNKLDVIILLPGLVLHKSDLDTLEVIKNSKCKLVILSDDPRCLRETLKYLKRKPDFVGMQNNDFVEWNGSVLEGEYVPLEWAQCYKFVNPIYYYKRYDFMVIANTSGDKYNRISILKDLISGLKVDIYGRLTDTEKEMLGKENCIGEIDYDAMQKVLYRSMSTLIIPIEKDLVTSKYIEAIQNRVVPIFYKDYNTKLLNLDNYPFIVENKEQLVEKLNYIKNNAHKVNTILDALYYTFVEQNIDGKQLNKIIKDIIIR